MKHTAWLNYTAVILFSLTLFLFLTFFSYLLTKEQISVFQAEQTHTYTTLTDMERSIIPDKTAPAGVVIMYQGILDQELSRESCLCFYSSHHDIEVYFDDVLVYSLSCAPGNRIARNVHNNWCSVHVGDEHAGESVTVLLTPSFKAAISKEPTFLLGSHYAIAMDVFARELPVLVLSYLSIMLGIFLGAVFLYFSFILKTRNTRLLYLGLFSVTLGLWKLLDLQCIPMLYPEYALAIGYISVGSLFLTGLCLLMYFSTLYEQNRRSILLPLSCFGSLLCLYSLGMQVFGITELRQNLPLSHALLICAILSIPIASTINKLIYKSSGISRSWKLFILLFSGIFIDLLIYYRTNDNSVLNFTIVSFIIYALIIFLGNVQKTIRKAYSDCRTGLENRIRWNEVLHSDTALSEPYAILFLDLNGLKAVNDTLGHEAGDRMIFQLSNILRNSLPRDSVICRWGGDEFAVLLTGVNRSRLDKLIDNLLTAAESYNENHPELPIHFAIGSALSSDHPGISRSDLFRLADEDMYHNKQLWYKQRG